MNIGRIKLSNWALFFVVSGALAAACTTKTTSTDDTSTGGGTTSSSSSSGSSSSSSSSGSSSSTSSSGSSSSSSGSSSCDTGGVCSDCANSACAQGVCGTELAACQNNAECIALNDCYAACTQGDTACFDQCDTDHATGVDDWYAWASCIICNPAACYGDCDGANSCA